MYAYINRCIHIPMCIYTPTNASSYWRADLWVEVQDHKDRLCSAWPEPSIMMATSGPARWSSSRPKSARWKVAWTDPVNTWPDPCNISFMYMYRCIATTNISDERVPLPNCTSFRRSSWNKHGLWKDDLGRNDFGSNGPTINVPKNGPGKNGSV